MWRDSGNILHGTFNNGAGFGAIAVHYRKLGNFAFLDLLEEGNWTGKKKECQLTGSLQEHGSASEYSALEPRHRMSEFI